MVSCIAFTVFMNVSLPKLHECSLPKLHEKPNMHGFEHFWHQECATPAHIQQNNDFAIYATQAPIDSEIVF